MNAFTEHWSRLRNRAARGILRAFFTEEAIGRGETSGTERTPDHQSRVAVDSPSEAAGAGHTRAGRTRTNASRPGQG